MMLSPVCTSKRPTLAHRASSRKSYCQIYCESLPTPTLQSSVLLCTSTNILQGALHIREHSSTVWCLLKDPLVLVPQEMLALKAHGESKGACDYGSQIQSLMNGNKEWIFTCILWNLWVCSALTKDQTQSQLTLTYTTLVFRGYMRFKGRLCYTINFLLPKPLMTLDQGQNSMVQKASTLLLLFLYKSIPEAVWV